jgi:hypothetical protein
MREEHSALIPCSTNCLSFTVRPSTIQHPQLQTFSVSFALVSLLVGKLIATYLVASVTDTSQRRRQYVSNRVPFMRIYGFAFLCHQMNYSYSRKLLISVILTIVYLCCPVMATATCCLPNGSTANDDNPCSGSLPSQCCPSGSICISNGLCFNTDSLVSRSSFSDST